MGTSTSFRAPSVPRWQAFVVALQKQLPLERVRSELFNAGEEWENALAGSGVGAFAAAIAQAWESFPDRLQAQERPEAAILALASEARRATAHEEATAALALAERAFTATLTRAASGDEPLSSRTAASAVEEFTLFRTAPGHLVGAYVQELLGQYARYVASRETGTLTEGPSPMRIGEIRPLIRRLAESAESTAESITDPGETPDEVKSRWDSVIRDVFARGRTLPEATQ
jgi:hypothetical protein